MAGRKAMDPDRYQMKDVKRRLTAVERFYQKQDAALQRINLRLKRRITHLEATQAYLKGFYPEEE